jgi:RNA-directed DNA polymerase
MITSSPHLYKRNGQKREVPDEVLDVALEWARQVEKHDLASVLTLNHLAHRTEVPYFYLRDLVQRTKDPYRVFAVAKRDGKSSRSISTPEATLMHVQRWILRYILNKVNNHPDSYAYHRGRSIKDCAARHVGARWLVKADLHNFFHSIDERMVYYVFKRLGYSPLVSFELSRICTRASGQSLRYVPDSWGRYHVIPRYASGWLGFLPQGAPTSGALANLVAQKFDELLSGFAQKAGLVYTRYADDIVFSSAEDFSRSKALDVLGNIESAAARCGFSVHRRKSRICPPGARKIVLGLLVDLDRVRLRKEFRGQIVTHVRGVEKFGLNSHRMSRNFTSSLGFIQHVEGLIAFAADIEPEWSEMVIDRWHTALSAQRLDHPIISSVISDG